MILLGQSLEGQLSTGTEYTTLQQRKGVKKAQIEERLFSKKKGGGGQNNRRTTYLEEN